MWLRYYSVIKIKASIVNLLLKALVQNNYSECIEDMETKKAKKFFFKNLKVLYQGSTREARTDRGVKNMKRSFWFFFSFF